MNAAELREALERLAFIKGYVQGEDAGSLVALADAATRWLKILEADPELVERIARIIHEEEGWPDWDGRETVGKRFRRETAQKILAAISTPTPGAE